MPFRIALSGLNAASSDLEVTANNIANVNTVGFKGSRPEFAAVFATSSQGTSSATIGSGVRLANVSQQFAQGNVDFTENGLDLALGGEGFFVLSDPAHVHIRALAIWPRQQRFRCECNGRSIAGLSGYGTGHLNTGQVIDLQIQTGASPPTATTQTDFGVNLPADSPQPTIGVFDPTDTNSFNHSTSVTIFDSLGASHTQTMYFVKEAATNEWTVHTTIDGTSVGAGQALVYGQDGLLQTPAGGSFTLPAYTPTTGAADLAIDVTLADATQFGSVFGVNSLSQDGGTTGTLAGLEIDVNGIVLARFTNGQATPLGKIALANFANTQGLQEVGAAWIASIASGDAVLGEANTSRFGGITSGALEASNVDLTAQLVNMITAQRNFQANAQMISTADTTTQTIINIR